MYGSCFATSVSNAKPRDVRTGPATSPVFMSKARVAASGDGPRPRIGSSRAKKPDSCTASPCAFADRVEVGGLADLLLERLREVGGLRLRLLVGELIGDLLPHVGERPSSSRPSCRSA